MKKRFQVVAVAVAAVILLSLVGYWILSAASHADDTFPPIDNALEIYTTAADATKVLDQMSLNISKNIRTTIGTEVFEENSQISYSFQGLNTPQMLACATESVTMGSHTFAVTECYSNGKAYVTVNDSRFASDISPADFSARFAPAVCLDPELYARVSGVDTGECYLISFEKAGAVESWITDPRTGFVSGSGMAYVSYEGKLLKSIYNLTYKNDNATVSLSFTVESVSTEENITTPTDTSSYVPVTYLDGPKLLEKASGYLMQAQNLSASYTDSIYFQAFGDKRVQNISVYTGFDENWSSLVTSQRTVTNTSREGEVSNTNETQLFLDGTYYAAKDGEALSPDKGIGLQDMQNYCRDRLLSTVILPKHIAQDSVTNGKTSITVHFSGNQAFAQLISANACQTLYQKPELLKEMAQSSTTEKLTCYLEIDKTTGLPLSAGIDYSGTFTIGELPYQLSFKADQIYTIPEKDANEIIKKAAD